MPDVKNVLANSKPDKEQCEVLLGCYLYAKETVMIHLNEVRGVSKEYKRIYLKTKVVPDPHLQTKRRSLVKTNNGTQVYDVFRMVRNIVMDIHDWSRNFWWMVLCFLKLH